MSETNPSSSGTWLVVGASGILGHGLCRYLSARGADVAATVHEHPVGIPGVREVRCSLEEDSSFRQVMTEQRPNIVVYAAGLTDVDKCESNEPLADRLHAEIPAGMAAVLAAEGEGRFVYISSDHLWDGTRGMMREDDPVSPINAYARSKAKGERLVADASKTALILRTNFFGQGRPWRLSLSDWMLKQLSSDKPFNAFSDAYFTPIAVPILFSLIENCLTQGLSGIFHAGGADRLSKYDFAMRLAEWGGYSQSLIRAGLVSDAGLVASRPADMSLSTQKLSTALGRSAPGLDDSLHAIFGPPLLR